jgi:hypothetical protein
VRAGTLIVDIAANVARLQQDMTQARGVVDGAMRDIKSSVNVAKTAIETLGVTVGAGMFAEMIKGTIEAEAGLVRLAQKAATSAEAMSSLTETAKRSSTDLDGIATGMQKLSKSMAEAGDGTSKAGKVFEALGISVTDASGQLRPAQAVMQELGQKLSSMSDQTLAVAFAQEVLGKSGANLLPFLYELAKAGELNAEVTNQQAKAAKDFEDNIKALEASGRALKISFVNEIVPSLIEFTTRLLEAQKESNNLAEALFRVATTGTSDVGGRLKQIDAELSVVNPDTTSSKVASVLTFGMSGIFDQAKTASLLKDRAYLQAVQRDQAIAGASALGDTSDARDLRLHPAALNVANPLGGGSQTDYYSPLAKSAQERIAALKAEKDATTPLTEAQKVLAKMQADLAAGYITLTPKQRESVKAWLDEEDALEKNKKSLEDWNKLNLEVYNTRAQYLNQQQSSVDTMQAENDRLKDQNEEIGLSTDQLNALKLARLDDAIAIAERNRMAASAGEEDVAYNRILDDQITRLKERRDLTQQGQFAQGAADQAKAAEEAFKKTASSIDQGLTNAIAGGLMHGFKDKGTSIVKDFITTLGAAFKAAVLTPVIKWAVSPISSAIAGMLPGSGSAGGGFNLLSLGSSAYSALSGNSVIGSIGSALGIGGAGAGVAEEAAALGISDLGAAGVGLSALGPIGLGIGAIGLLSGLFGGGHGPKASDVSLQPTGAGGVHFSQNNVTDSAWGEQFDRDFGPMYAQLGPKGQAFLNQYAGKDWQASGPASAQSLVAQYIQPLIDQAKTLDAAATQQQDAAQQQQDAAQQQADNVKQMADLTTQQDTIGGQLASTVRGLSGQLGIDSLQGGVNALATSVYVAPLDRLAAARAQLSSSYSSALGGDLGAVQSFPGLLQSTLGIARDTYASGPEFQALFAEGNRMLNDLLAHQRDLQADMIKDVPATVLQASNDQIAEIRKQTATLVSSLKDVSDQIDRLKSAMAA